MATNFENRESQNGRTNSSKGTSRSMMTPAKSRPQASRNANSVNPTVQKSKPQAMVLYCHVCKRKFGNEKQMRMHLASAKDHGARVERHTSSSTGANHGSKKTDLVDKTVFTTVIPSLQQSAELELLSKHSHTSEDLVKRGYRLSLYTAEDIAGLSRCKNCKALQSRLKIRSRSDCVFHTKPKQIQRDGQKLYPCCGELGPGCEISPVHIYGEPDRLLAAKYQEFAFTPGGSNKQPLRHQAVTLDCEMAGLSNGRSEVILLCVADYFTGETLINSLVSPNEKVVDWRTRFSGVSRKAMADAEAQSKTLKGWQEARHELWKYIDADTILVGHALQNDLDVLRMIHTNVVDSAILAATALGPDICRSWALKQLCDELLGIKIQNKGRQGHDCLEDALAAREVVLWCCRHPQELESWGQVKRAEEEEKMKARKQAREEREREKESKLAKEMGMNKEKGKENQQRPPPSKSTRRPRAKKTLINHSSSDHESEVLRWSDIAEDMDWPEGYYPWSD
ncbi:hypothetical protein MMC07_002027 [Pseudocyphellaria aurata]|nr:hypothetical protein [Pseudocyphellaria aurata]